LEGEKYQYLSNSDKLFPSIALVKKFDGEFPKRYFSEVMKHIGMEEERFFELCDNARSPHLWEQVDGKWQIKKQARIL